MWSCGTARPALATVKVIGRLTRMSASGGGAFSPSNATRPAIVKEDWRAKARLVMSSPSTVTSANAIWLLPGDAPGGEADAAAVLRARIRYCPGGTALKV